MGKERILIPAALMLLRACAGIAKLMLLTLEMSKYVSN
jgi:hypothetical protein